MCYKFETAENCTGFTSLKSIYDLFPNLARNGSFLDTIELTVNGNSDMNRDIEYYVTMVRHIF